MDLPLREDCGALLVAAALSGCIFVPVRGPRYGYYYHPHPYGYY